ncbi:MAG TPA: hypothetical protein VE991_10585 [Acidimicrobiales bacterium]|nr:hypothetical protein [Acidimicrobiales bacterium]
MVEVVDRTWVVVVVEVVDRTCVVVDDDVGEPEVPAPEFDPIVVVGVPTTTDVAGVAPSVPEVPAWPNVFEGVAAPPVAPVDPVPDEELPAAPYTTPLGFTPLAAVRDDALSTILPVVLWCADGECESAKAAADAVPASRRTAAAILTGQPIRVRRETAGASSIVVVVARTCMPSEAGANSASPPLSPRDVVPVARKKRIHDPALGRLSESGLNISMKCGTNSGWRSKLGNVSIVRRMVPVSSGGFLPVRAK